MISNCSVVTMAAVMWTTNTSITTWDREVTPSIMSSSPPRGSLNNSNIGDHHQASSTTTTTASTSTPSSSSGASSNPALGSYLGQLAAANHIRRLVERYISLAPVFIGGPSNTSLETPPGSTPAASSASKQQPQLTEAGLKLRAENELKFRQVNI